MINLIVFEEDVNGLESTSFGGRPVKNQGSPFEWPTCRTCSKPMQFLGKLATDKGLAQIFMCQNDPGMCDDFDPRGGGNAVVVVNPIDLVATEPPAEGETLRDCEHGAKVVRVAADNYEDARARWLAESGKKGRQVLGQLYGEPSWLQNDETPACRQCSQPMRLVAQLEQGPDWKTEMNFGGGGSAYIFECQDDGSALFLWQS